MVCFPKRTKWHSHIVEYPWVAYNPVSMQYIIVTVHIVKLPQVLSPLPCASHIYVSCITAQHLHKKQRVASQQNVSFQHPLIPKAGHHPKGWTTNITWVSNPKSYRFFCLSFCFSTVFYRGTVFFSIEMEISPTQERAQQFEEFGILGQSR